MLTDKGDQDNGISMKFGADRKNSVISKKGEYQLVMGENNVANGKKGRMNGTTKEATIIKTSPFVFEFAEPVTEILGTPDLFIDVGSTINLTCIIQHSPEPPAYIFWNHNDTIISYDSSRGGVSVVTEKSDRTTSFLLVQLAQKSDSGRYTCNPSNAQPKSINVHVLNGEHPAAMQHGGQAHQPRFYSLLLCLCLLLY
ncbi:uncharacterized protein LOC106642229 [Copidosoma floridanum]|uniref:uncharacterized protein LOC106642229 n=1 Tax=Copidosoma floridanum TaxID=29053 RepID=UPI0006C9E189|nr:uncharacterized protein LOC106642229 [Copidosoma floridanum]